eukprot:1098200-Prorocentrum_minimum.AAC.1
MASPLIIRCTGPCTGSRRASNRNPYPVSANRQAALERIHELQGRQESLEAGAAALESRGGAAAGRAALLAAVPSPAPPPTPGPSGPKPSAAVRAARGAVERAEGAAAAAVDREKTAEKQAAFWQTAELERVRLLRRLCDVRVTFVRRTCDACVTFVRRVRDVCATYV